MPIQVLSIHLVNKIAAGEVIERPASVVKELVENAIDAGATQIDVTVEDGGRRLIAVTDNGAGMDAADLALAFVPHATSKIAAEDDLYRIETMGFRGEALASIASISHAHIRTGLNPGRASSSPAKDAVGGHEIEASGENVGTVRPCAAAGGTTITIRDLFFNTPARRKFMKTAATELGHITEQLTRVALPYPQIGFTLTHNGRTVHNLPPAASTPQRVRDLFGQEIADGLLSVSRKGASVRVSGLTGLPTAARATGKWQYIFLNGRYIRDRLLAHALREGYRGLIDPSRWPVAFLFLDIDPAEVDVNVHPTKIEVRFRDSQLVHGELLAALKETLNRANLAPDFTMGQEEKQPPAAANATTAPAQPLQTGPAGEAAAQERQASLREALADFFKSVPPPQPRLSFPEPPRNAPPTPRADEDGPWLRPIGQPSPAPRLVQHDPLPRPAAVTAPELVAAHLPRRAMQIHDSYIVTACEEGLLIIDQHALHERLIYNDLKRRLAEGSLEGQRLLIPPTLNVTPAEQAAAEAHANLLQRLGIELESFGPQSLAVQQFPTLLAQRGIAPAEFVREILDRLCEEETTQPERLLEELLDTMACKAAVKAGDPLGPAEMETLLQRRTEADKGSACPHGRPTTLTLTLKDLQKQFKRT